MRDRPRQLHSSWRARTPRHWGRSTWDALFRLAADYPHARECDDDDPYLASLAAERRASWRRLLKSLPGILPCGECAYHFERYLRRDGGAALERALRDRESLYRWLYRAKDEVNRREGRHSPPLAEVRRRYIPACGTPPRARP